VCDTFVGLGDTTADGGVVFAKNSDRQPNEAHVVVLLPAADHPANAQVSCTYLGIPQVRHTYAVLLAKPYWIWGAEMGANEHGVVIGNEAVFTKVPYDKGAGLLGMDLLRLALERAATAEASVTVITELLERHGQGGNAGHTHPFYYHNSFLIADPTGAWVLETAGRHWAAQRVPSSRSISNAITVGAEWDHASAGLVDYAVRKHWCSGPDDFDFGRCYSDRIYTRFSAAKPRQCRTTELLAAARGALSPGRAIATLRDHGPAAGPGWTPAHGLTGADVCMHAGYGPVRTSQCTGSLVAHLSPRGATYWVTATSAPCTSVFKPVWFDAGLPDLGPTPTGRYDPATRWWRHEDLHRATLRDYPAALAAYHTERDAVQADLLAAAAAAAGGTADDRRACTAEAFTRVDIAEAEWLHRLRTAARQRAGGGPHGRAWRGFDHAAGRPSDGAAHPDAG